MIASQPPVVRVNLDRATYKAGDAVKLKVSASKSTRTIVARMRGAEPVYLRWNVDAKSNTGDFFLPSHLPPGRHKLTVIAEDIAHNISTEEVQLEVVR